MNDAHHEEHADHAHPSGRSEDLAEMFTGETWDARYSESTRMWSGRPNPTLVTYAGDLAPGRALDVGCGEGADAVWLAEQGWRVTAVDVSAVALERTAEHAAGAGVGERVETAVHDLMGGAALPGGFDLVTAHFMHVPVDLFDDFHRRLGAAVRPGGVLLVVGHHPHDFTSGARDPHAPDLLFPPEKVVAALGDGWEIRVAEAPAREMVKDDRPVTVRDSVVLAVRE